MGKKEKFMGAIAALAVGAAALTGCQMEPSVDVDTVKNKIDKPDTKTKHLIVSKIKIVEKMAIPDYGLRDPNLIKNFEKILSFDGTETIVKLSPRDMLFYMTETGTDLEIREEIADDILYPFKNKEKNINWSDIETINGIPRGEIRGPRGKDLGRGWECGFVSVNSYFPIDETAEGKVLEIEQVDSATRRYMLDMNGDGKITLNFTWDSNEADESDKILEVNKFWPTHRDMYESLSIGSRVEIDALNWLIYGIDENPSRIVRTPESGVKSYDGRDYDNGAIFDYIAGRPTKEAYDASKESAKQLDAGADVAARSVAAAAKMSDVPAVDMTTLTIGTAQSPVKGPQVMQIIRKDKNR